MIMIPNEDVIRKAAPHFLAVSAHILDRRNPAYVFIAVELFLGAQAVAGGFQIRREDVIQVFRDVQSKES